MTNAQVKADIAANLPDNTSGLITPAKLRTEMCNMVDYSDTAAAAITLAGLGGVPTTRTVNGHALSSDVTVTASDVGLGSVENTALSTWAGSANLATVGTISSGTWNGTAIADSYISSAATWNAKVSFPGFGTTAGTAAEGNDSRLSDARTPTTHNQAWSTITSTPTTLSGYGITDAQPLDSDLTALAGLSTTGLVARTDAGTAATRTITGTTNQITVTNGDGISGDPTLALPQDVATTSTPRFARLGLGKAADGTKAIDAMQAIQSTVSGGSNATNIYSYGGLAAVSLYSANGTSASPTPWTEGAELDKIIMYSYGETTFSQAVAQIATYATEDHSDTAKGTRITISGTPTKNTTRSEWMTLKDGNVGIGTTSPAARLDLGASTGVVQYIYNDDSANAGLGINLSGGSCELSLFAGADGDDAGRISFGRRRVDTGTYTERMVVDATGNIGIGTSSPAAQLHLRSGSDNIAEAIRLDNPTDESDNGSKIVWRNADVSKDAAFFAARRIGSSNGMALTFGTAEDWSTAAATEKMRIAGNGNVGINNTNPQRKLDVVGDSNGNGIRVTGTTGTIGAFTAEGTSVNIQADSADATCVLVDASANDSGFVELNGGSSGYVQLGTGGTARMQVFASGSVKLNSYGAGTLQTDSSGNVTASSDARLKNVTGDFSRGLADVLKLTPRIYHWNEKSGMNTEDENVGFIAQEVQDAIPEAVGTMKTTDYEEDDAATGKKVRKSKREAAEYLTLSDRPLIAALVNAVKELKAENDTLRARVSALENGKAAK